MTEERELEDRILGGFALLMGALIGKFGKDMQGKANEMLTEHCYDCILAPNPLIKRLKSEPTEEEQ